MHLQLGLILGSGMALFVKVLYKLDDSSNQRRIFNPPIPVETVRNTAPNLSGGRDSPALFMDNRGSHQVEQLCVDLYPKLGD